MNVRNLGLLRVLEYLSDYERVEKDHEKEGQIGSQDNRDDV